MASSRDDGHRQAHRRGLRGLLPPIPSGGEWLSVCIERTLRRCFTALHAVVDADTFMFLAVTVRTRPSGIAKEFIPLLERGRHRSLEYVYADRALPFQEERVVCPRHRRMPGRQAGEVPRREGLGVSWVQGAGHEVPG